MGICNKCGAQVADSTKFCTSCGNQIAAAQPQAAQQPPQYNHPTQYAQPYQQPVHTEEPISIGSYVLMFLLLMIPIVNVICIIVWACGGSSKKNKVNLSRAILIWMLIGAIFAAIVALAGGMLLGSVGGLEGLQDTITNGVLENLN